MESLKIILLCIFAAVLYGILHDQITARICVEYFTVGHPPVFETNSPTLLALGWGIIATWWVGAILGVLIAASARLGDGSKLTARQLVGPISILLTVMAITALLAGIVGYWLARNGAVYLVAPFDTLLPAEKHAAFIADLWTHLASYGVGFIGGVVICAQTIVRRNRLSRTLHGT